MAAAQLSTSPVDGHVRRLCLAHIVHGRRVVLILSFPKTPSLVAAHSFALSISGNA